MTSTRISIALQRLTAGDEDQRSELFDALREELHRIASSHLLHERAGHTLQPTALVNEAWLKLADQATIQDGGRLHFLSVASLAMRRILVDHARGKHRDKRGRGFERKDVHEITLTSIEDDGAGYDLHALDDALTDLATRSARQARIIELRFFGGMTSAEVAESLEVSLSTVDREWKFARLWLLSVLN